MLSLFGTGIWAVSLDLDIPKERKGRGGGVEV